MAKDSVPTAEEYALFREAYAETYPVRPLLNAIDAKDAEIERLAGDNHALAEQVRDFKAHYATDHAEVERYRAALVRIGEQAREGIFTEHGECPATFACSAIIAELIHLGIPPEGVVPADETTPACNCAASRVLHERTCPLASENGTP